MKGWDSEKGDFRDWVWTSYTVMKDALVEIAKTSTCKASVELARKTLQEVVSAGYDAAANERDKDDAIHNEK